MKTTRLLQALIFALAFQMLAGCAFVPGRRLTLFPSDNELLESTKNVTRAVPSEPLALPRELSKAPAPEHRVQPGDVILLGTADPNSLIRLPADQTVMPDGMVYLGRFGKLQVMHLTTAEIANVATRLVNSTAPDAGRITVRLISTDSDLFYVLGEVNSPGPFPLVGRETVLDAILAAGGLTERASHRKIILSRPSHPHGCRIVLPICYDQIVQLGDTTSNYQLQSGDRIFVATRTLSEELLPSFFLDRKGCAAKDHVACFGADCQQCDVPFASRLPSVPQPDDN